MQCLLHWIMFQQGNGYNESKHKVSSDFFYRYTVHVLHQHLRYVTVMDPKSINVTSRKACLKLFTLDVVQPYWSASLTNWESEPARAELLHKVKKLSNLNTWILSFNQIILHCSFIVLILIPNYFFHYTVNLYCVLKMHIFVIFEIRYLAKHNKSALFTHFIQAFFQQVSIMIIAQVITFCSPCLVAHQFNSSFARVLSSNQSYIYIKEFKVTS